LDRNLLYNISSKVFMEISILLNTLYVTRV
jgi:hypothetical protein